MNSTNIFTTINLTLPVIIMLLLFIIESCILMLLFTSLLNISYTKKQKIIFITLLSTLKTTLNYILPLQYNLYFNIIIIPLLITFIFKTNMIKSIIIMLLSVIPSIIIESIIIKLCYLLFKISYQSLLLIPNYIFLIKLPILTITFLIYIYIKKRKIHLNYKNIKLNYNFNNSLFIIILFICIISICIHSYILILNNNNFSPFIIISNLITSIVYIIVSIYVLYKNSKFEIIKQDLEESQLYTKTLELLYDNTRAFKHDFSNIIQALSGYIYSEDIKGLKIYFKELNKECTKTSNLSALNPKIINNPAIYSILTSKYYKANENGIKIHSEIFLDLNKLNVNTYYFTRILGILLDNAIEASLECEEKIINLMIRNDFNVNRQLLIIENTYNNKDIDTLKIFEKGYSTKPKNTGIGLWEVNEILNKNSNLSLFTSKDKIFFKQQLEIY